MANLKNEYTQHIHNTAPDMDKLWNRISAEIDRREAEAEKTETEQKQERKQIKHTSNFMKIAAAAAAFIVVIAGANMLNKTKETKVPYEKAASSGTVQADDMEIQDTHKNENTIKYEQLRFQTTNTAAYMEQYVPAGNEYFVEKDVLEETEFFADVIVESADLSNMSSATYTMKVNAVYYKDIRREIDHLTIVSSTPYILQANREYLLPLKQTTDGNYALVFENAPQIELTLDGGAVFQNGWTVLAEDSQSLEKKSLSANDFFFDRMRYIPELDINRLLEEWGNA